MTRITMNFGRGGLPLDLEDAWEVTVIRKPQMPLLADPAAAVAQALARPVGGAPLAELARTARQACILICDITRPVPNGLLLPPVLRTLTDAGMRPQQITILIATGLHRPNLGAELREVIGDDWVLNNFRIENHDACADADHVDLGPTSQGIGVQLDRRLVQADLRLAVGLVEPHFMAGYSGGRKLIMPGVAHQQTIRRLHSAAILEHPGTRNCRLEGNPLHQQQLEIVARLGGALGLNVVLDDHRRLSLVNFGEINASHLAAVDFVRRYAEVPVPQRFATVITSGSGYPLDRNFYQTIKGMVAALDVLEEGGDLIVVSECCEGLGSEAFVRAQEHLVAQGPEPFLKTLLDKPVADIDEWSTQMQLKAMRRGRVQLYAPALSPQQAHLTGIAVVEDLPAAIRRSLQAHHGTGRPVLAVIPEGPYVVPYLAKS